MKSMFSPEPSRWASAEVGNPEISQPGCCILADHEDVLEPEAVLLHQDFLVLMKGF